MLPLLRAEEVDMVALRMCTDGHLKDFGLKGGHRVKIANALGLK